MADVSMRSSSLDVLEHLARTVGVEFDYTITKQAFRQAEREIPGQLRTVWYARMVEAGKEIGLRITDLERSVREVIGLATSEAPVVGYVPPREEEPARWLVLTGHRGRRVRVAGLGEGQKDRWISERELARLVGVSNVREPIRWLVAEALTPYEPLSFLEPSANGRVPRREGRHVHPLRRLFWMMRPEGRDIRVIFAFAVAVGILTLAIPLTVEALVTTVAMSLLIQQLIVLSLVLLICLLFAAAMRALQAYVAEIIQRRLFARLAADLAYRLPRVRRDTYDKRYGPELVNRFFDVVTVQKVASFLLLDGLTIILQTFVGLLVLAFYHPFLLGYDIVVIFLMTFILFQLGRGAIRTSIAESRAKYMVADQLEEMARSPLVYKLSAGGEFALDRTDTVTRLYLNERSNHFRILFRQIVFSHGFQAVAMAALLGLGGWLVIREQLTLGQLVAAELIVALVAGSFAKLGKHLESFYDLMASIEKIGILIDLPLEHHEGERHFEHGRPAALRLIDVSFAYPGGKSVLHDVNLRITPGERVAIVGPSGSGKTTLVELLFGLRRPTGGHIELDGVDLRNIRLESLRDHVAVVKDLEILNGTIIENVRAGRHELTLADIRRALDAVELLGELANLPDGLYTHLITGGAPLSRGQARRLMIARAIAGQPRLLVLDETLDGLDLDVRNPIIGSLFDPATPWTLLVITHSTYISRHCDRTLSLAGGRAEEIATKTTEEIHVGKAD